MQEASLTTADGEARAFQGCTGSTRPEATWWFQYSRGSDVVHHVDRAAWPRGSALDP